MFEKDLKEWKEVELEFARQLIDQKLRNLEFAPDKKFTDWDIKTTVLNEVWEEVEKTYEIKHDIVSDTSGNVWFEYYCNNKPSGIYASKADYIVYKLWDNFYCMNRAKLLIRLNHVARRVVKWWDNNLAYMYLVKKEEFMNKYQSLA